MKDFLKKQMRWVALFLVAVSVGYLSYDRWVKKTPLRPIQHSCALRP